MVKLKLKRWFIYPASFVLLLLVAGFYINNEIQLLSDANATGSQLQSCEVMPVMRKNTNNVKGLNPENISFLNWNIYKGHGENWQQDLAGFSRDHDVMTIQEAVMDKSLAGLLDRHAFNWVMNTAFYLKGEAAGVMTVANSEAVHSCGFKVKEPIIRVPKSALISYYAIRDSDERLLVANIHGINFTLGVNAYRKQLDKLHDAIEHHDGPMIVAGDFNSWSANRMRQVHQLINKLSLSEIEYPVNNKTHVFGNAIDHVFYRQLELVDHQVWHVSSSDHNPISVSFRVQSSAL